jgi:cytolethal distending toxin subunit A
MSFAIRAGDAGDLTRTRPRTYRKARTMIRRRSLAILGGATCATALLGALSAASGSPAQALSMGPSITTDNTRSADVPIVIRNVNSRLCLTVAGGGTANNLPAVQYTCDAHPSRYWVADRPLTGTFRLKNVNSNRCLTIAAGSTANNAPAVQYTCDGHPSRYWRVINTGVGLKVVNVNSNLCLTIAGGSTANNARAVQYTCDGHPSRRWY